MELVLAASPALKSTIGLVVVFFVAFPLLVHGLLAYTAAQIMGEHQDNQGFARGDDIGPSQG
jgi:hypothetical protein